MKKILIITAGFLMSAQVFAACTESNLDGDWVMYQAAVTDTKEHTGVCEISVSEGVIDGTCDLSNGFNGLAEGTVMINQDCSADMHLVFPETDTPLGPITSEFELQLSSKKQSFIGRWENIFGVVGTTNGMKK